MKIDDTIVNVSWEENESVDALMDMCKDSPIEIRMSMYGGFEQVGFIGTSLPRKDVQTTTSMECDPMDQTNACLFLASDMGKHVKGQVIQVCNGAFL